MADADLSRLDAWFGKILSALEPGARRRAILKLGQALRRANLARIADNTDPDGVAFAPRKPRFDRDGKLLRIRNRRMYKGLRRMRHWKVDATPDEVAIEPADGRVDRLASVSQFAETATVGRTRRGALIRARYAERRLLGFGREDMDLALDVASEMMTPDR